MLKTLPLKKMEKHLNGNFLPTSNFITMIIKKYLLLFIIVKWSPINNNKITSSTSYNERMYRDKDSEKHFYNVSREGRI